MTVQRILTDNNQAITGPSASSVKPSNAIKRTAVSRSGNGRISLTGPYTGAADTDIDVEIVSGGSNRITQPSFAGVGSGQMSDMAVLAGATPQKWQMVVIDLGVDTATAEAQIEGVVLRALSSGAAGNSVSITVDQSGITEAATSYSLLESLSAGAEIVQGVGYDWDTAVGTETEIPASAKRLTIGSDSTIYRQWKYYQDGKWNYRFMPEIAMEHAAGDAVKFVSGSRTVTITDGVTTENYTGVVTLYDLLAQIRDNPSALVEVVGVISPDLITDNPQAVLDLRTRTDARVDSTSGDGSPYATGFVDYSAGASANTELITAECYAVERKNGAGVGREKWKLSGSVSGDLGTLITDILYDAPGKFSLRIPQKLPDGYTEGQTGDISAAVSYADRQSGNPPAVCVDALQLGPDAVDGVIKWVYTKRPTTDCPCESVPYLSLPGTCLFGDEAQATTANPEYTIRKDRADARLTGEFSTTSARYGEPHDVMLSLLDGIFTGTTSWDEWAASTAYSEGDSIQAGDYRYRAENDGTSGASAPTFPTKIGETVTDGTVVWICMAKKPLVWWDELLDALTQITSTETQAPDIPVVWAKATGCTVASGDSVRVHNDKAGGYIEVTCRVTTGGTLGTEPDYSSATDITYHEAVPNSGGTAVLEVESVVCAATSCPTLTGFPNTECGTTHDNEVLAYMSEHYEEILAAAEVYPDAAGNQNKCWPDNGSDYWWVPDTGGYLPAFTNQEYHSVKMAGGEVVPTYEFGFVIKVDQSCVGQLQEGDTVTLTIGDAGWPPTYQVGDRLYLSTIAAGALNLVGGVDGTDEITFQVQGSVDGLTADYVVDKNAPPALYDNGQIQARITPGGIGFELGDTFTFCVETGQFRWRQDGGAWSAPADIGTTSLVDGLSVTFEDGACPSFVAGDSASFTAYQPHAISSAQHPDDGRYAWDGTGTVITLPVSGNVDTLAIAMHTLPSSAAVSVTDGTDTWPMTVRDGVMVLLFDPVLSSPTLTVTITNAPDAEIGWLWAGMGLEFDAPGNNASRKSSWNMNRGNGVNPSAAMYGKSRGWKVIWEGFITRAEAEALEAGIDTHKSGGDWPAVFIPATDNPDYAAMVTFPDDVDFSDFWTFSCPGREEIEFEMTLNGWVY